MLFTNCVSAFPWIEVSSPFRFSTVSFLALQTSCFQMVITDVKNGA